MKRYKLFVQLNEYNQQISNGQYTHYAESCNADSLINVAEMIDTPCCIVDIFTGKEIWKK